MVLRPVIDADGTMASPGDPPNLLFDALGTGSGHAHFVGDVSGAGHLGRFGFDDPAFIIRSDRSLERDLPSLRDHFHVMRITGQGLVSQERLPDLPRDVTIAGVL